MTTIFVHILFFCKSPLARLFLRKPERFDCTISTWRVAANTFDNSSTIGSCYMHRQRLRAVSLIV